MPQRKQLLVSLALPSLVILSGCSVGPDYRAPDKQMADAWNSPLDCGLADGEADVTEWWQSLGDPMLADLIARAAEGNLDLRMAVLRIRQARALRGVAAGALLPSLTGNSSYERSKLSGGGLLGAAQGGGAGSSFSETFARGMTTSTLTQSITNAAPGAANIASPLASSIVSQIPSSAKRPGIPELDLFSTGFDASWEIDVFGGLRRGVEAADAELDAALEDYRAVLVSMLAEVATTYIDVRTLQAEIDTTRQNIDLQKETLDLTQARLSYDLASELEVSQAQTNLATTESQLPQLEANLATAIYRLSVLVGKEPSALQDELTSTKPIPQPPAETFVGVPTDILRRRPDLRAAERRLAAATAEIGVSAADLYPRFTLSGNFGFESMTLKHALDSKSITYGFGPAVRWNIFDGLRNLNRIAAQQVAAHHAYVGYEQTLLLALQEVETAMVNYRREQDRRDALMRATEAARRAVKLSETRYEDGLTDFQDVVDAERSLVNLETALVQSQGQVAVNLVALYKALGGGWSPTAIPQQNLLDAPMDALDRPLRFFFSGGKTELPWNIEAKTPAAPAAAGGEQD